MKKFLLDTNILIELIKNNVLLDAADFESLFTVDTAEKEFITDFIGLNARATPSEENACRSLWEKIPKENVLKVAGSVEFADTLESALNSDIKYSIALGTQLCDICIAAVAEKYPTEYTYVTDDDDLQKILLGKNTSCINYEEFMQQVSRRRISLNRSVDQQPRLFRKIF